MRDKRRIHWLTYLFLTPVALFTILPIVYMTSTAFKPLDELFLYPPRFFVHHPVLDNFEGLLIPYSVTDVPFIRYVFNTVVVTGGTVVGSVVISSLAAYPLAKHQMPGRNLIFTVVIAALMFAPEVTQIPRYLVVHWLGFIDTYAGLIIPNLAAAYGLFLM
jgi:ABC-type glycerol-3-phosphate transport system permease component